MVYTGHQLEDVGRSLSWDALRSFLRYPAPDSALMREMHPESAAWVTTTKTNAILADIYDILAAINANLVAVGSRKAAKAPRPYPRPSTGKNGENERHIGSGALPPDELEKWFEEKRRDRNARGSTGNADRDPGSGGRAADTDG
jgi:hypothetical protein